MNNFNVEALRNSTTDGGGDVRAESNIGEAVSVNNSETPRATHHERDANQLEQAEPAQLIATIKALRRKCQAYRLRAVTAEKNIEGFTNIAASRIAEMRARVIELEAQVAAIRAGLIDIDAWVLLDLSTITFGADGALEGLTESIEALRQAKPFLFKGEKQ
jgi:hypothetical protein